MNRFETVENDIGGMHRADASSAAEAVCKSLPDEGRAWDWIRAEILARKCNDYDWRRGRISLYVYHDDDDLLTVSREAYNLCFSENALGRRAFPSLARMEDDVIQISRSLFHAPEGSAGCFTSGGTESIFLAMQSARDHFRSVNSGRTPTVVLPRTAHPAFDKAAHYLGVDVIRTGIGGDLRAEIAELRSAIDRRTMMVVGSAPCYPYGVYDPIRALGEVAIENKVWLHVDACLGGFLAPFARAEGYPIPEFDFCVPGVTSLSADLHKFGFGARGASVLIYCSANLKAYQVFSFDNWPRGSYATETFPGSRPGGAVASAWAVLQFLGHAGYRRLAKKTMEAKRRLVHGIEQIPGLRVIRPSDLNIVLYQSVEKLIDINAVAQVLDGKGWFVGRSSEPRAIHFALNAVHAPVIGEYLFDLAHAVEEARRSGPVGVQDNLTY